MNENEREALALRTEATLFGDEVRLALTVELPVGVHIEPYQPDDPHLIPTELEVEGLRDVTIEYPAPVVKDLGWKDLPLHVLDGTLVFIVSGRIQENARRITGTLSFQPCVGGACLPPRAVQWESPVSGTCAYSVLHALAPSRPVLAPVDGKIINGHPSPAVRGR